MDLYTIIVNYLRNFWWGGDPDEVDSISGLTLRDVYAVQKSWAVVYADQVKYGLEIFKRLFRADPETKNFFEKFKNLSEEQLAMNVEFKAHAINLMGSINQAVMQLKQPEVVIVIMNKLGESHGMKHVQRKHFNVVKQVLVGMLLELKLSDDVINSWDKCVNFFYRHIFDKLNDS